MPELPEVEVVRAGLAAHVLGRTVAHVEVLHPRAVRRHVAGGADLAARLQGRTLAAARRRGKYLWIELDEGDEALVLHLGMSGQLVVQAASAVSHRHVRVVMAFTDGDPDLRFVDQRTFGGLALEPLVPAGEDGAHRGTNRSGRVETVPASVAHIARDPLDPAYDLERVVRRLRARRTGLKRALLDQTLVSGIGNIYADEALWRAGLHGERPSDRLTRPQARLVLESAAQVMTEALAQGGTSFDDLYVHVDGTGGYFERSLAAYGRAGRPCLRCGALLRRESFMNRSSFSCPRCQPRPRAVTTLTRRRSSG